MHVCNTGIYPPSFVLADYDQQDKPEMLFTYLAKGVKKAVAGL